MSLQLDDRLIVAAYRALYRSGLRAVCFSVPARYILRDQLRNAFRKSPPNNYDETRIRNTVKFLAQASMARGIEHKILKNIIHVRYYEREQFRLTASHGQWLQGGAVKTPFAWTSQERRDGYRAFENALEMLNDNHQLCLR